MFVALKFYQENALLLLETEIRYNDAVHDIAKKEKKYNELCNKIKQKEQSFAHKIEDMNLNLEQDKFIDQVINQRSSSNRKKK